MYLPGTHLLCWALHTVLLLDRRSLLCKLIPNPKKQSMNLAFIWMSLFYLWESISFASFAYIWNVNVYMRRDIFFFLVCKGMFYPMPLGVCIKFGYLNLQRDVGSASPTWNQRIQNFYEQTMLPLTIAKCIKNNVFLSPKSLMMSLICTWFQFQICEVPLFPSVCSDVLMAVRSHLTHSS